MRKKLTAKLRKISINKRLNIVILLESIVLVLLVLSMVSNSFSTIYQQAHSSGQQLLYSAASQMDDACSELRVLTKYPVLASAYGSSQIFDYLNAPDSSAHSGTENMSMQYELASQLMLHPNATLMGVADLNGSLLYCDTGNVYYKVVSYRSDSPLVDALVALQGGFMQLSGEEVGALIPDLPTVDNALYGARAIMKLNHLEPIGLIICRVDISSSMTAFSLGRIYDQELSLFADDGHLLFGTPREDMAQQLQQTAVNTVETSWRYSEGGMMLCQLYRTPSGITACLFTPLKSLVRSMPFSLVMLIILLPVFVIFVLVLTHMLVRSVRDPIDRLMELCQRIQQEDFTPIADDNAEDEMHSLIVAFNLMSAHIGQLIEVVYKKNMLQAETEMQLIRSQINPHFVYNTLEAIRATAYAHGENEIADMTALLGKTLRYGISRQRESVTVAQELFHLQDYIALQKMHLGQQLDVYVNVDASLYSCRMIPLVLQPLVENAIHHGLPENGQSGSIRILGYEEEGALIFTVSDDGPGIPEDRLRQLQDYICEKNDDFTSIGLRNTHRRLVLSYGDRYGLSIRSVAGHGTVVTVRMPCLRGQDAPAQEGEPHDFHPDC